MKKTLQKAAILFSLATSFSIANAQIDGNGKIAPNYQGYDIFGNYYDFYADYLDNNIPIILDISAHWCGPCWSYHNTKVLEDLYNQYGPNGTIQDSAVMVIWADGDNSSTFAELYGGAGSQGNWVYRIEGADTVWSPFPIFGGDTGVGANAGRQIATLYEINYFPTVFMIHPDRTVEEIGAISQVNGIMNYVNNANPISIDSIDAKMHYLKEIPNMCEGGSSNFSFTVKNMGTTPMTSATIHIIYDGNVIDSVNWTGNLSQYEMQTISSSITNVEVGDHTIEVKVAKVNGVIDENNTNDAVSRAFKVAQTDETVFKLTVNTDAYGNETSWLIRNSENQIITTKSDYFSSAYGNQQSYTHEIILEYNDCYKIILTDSYGDGMTFGGNNPGLTLRDAQNQIIASIGPDFESEATTDFERLGEEPSNISTISNNNVSVYPNPIINEVHIELNNINSSIVKTEIINMLGEIVSTNEFSNVSENKNLTIDTESLSKGVYMLNISIGNETFSKKLIK